MPAGLPSAVAIREVGPRDGFQNEPETIATADKVAADRPARRAPACGGSRSRASCAPTSSRSSPTRARCSRRSTSRQGVARSVLVPNERGLDDALALRERFDEIAVFLSASEEHNWRNVNRTVDQSLAELHTVIARARGGRAARRGGHLDELRLPLRGGRRPRARARDRAPARRGGRRGDRLRRHDRDGEPRPGRGALRAGRRAARRRRAAHRALSQHARAGARERARRAAGRLRVV